MSKAWNAVESLRGNTPIPEYVEIIVVGSLILYLDEKPEYSNVIETQKILRAETGAREELIKALKKIENKIPYFKGVFAELEGLNQLESTQITRLLYELSSIDKSMDVGEWLNKTLKELDRQIGGLETSHDTPESINNLAISILNATEGSFYDGVSGHGGGLLKAQQNAWKQNGNLKLHGQELNGAAWAISKIRLFISGDSDNEIKKGDVLSSPKFLEGNNLKKFSFIFMDAPFSMRINNYEDISNDMYNRFFYGMPSRSNGDYAFISHLLASLNEEGRAIVVTSGGALFRGGAEGRIRNNIILADLIETVISLPAGLYNTTGIPVNLIVFNKNKSETRQNKVQFIKADELYSEKGRNKKYVSDEDAEKIVSAIKNGSQIDEFSTLIDISDLIDNILLPSRYILPRKVEIEGFGQVNFDVNVHENINTIPLKDNATFFRGFNVGSKNEEHPEGEFKIVRLSDVQNGEMDMDGLNRYTIDNNAKTDMYRLKKHDVILSIRGSSLKVAVVPVDDERLLLSQNFIGIRCNEDLDPYFLKVYLESPLGQYLLTNKMSGTTIATLSRKDVETLEVPSIPIEEQKIMMKSYNTTENYINKEIDRLKTEMLETKIQTYVQMGIKDVFNFKSN